MALNSIKKPDLPQYVKINNRFENKTYFINALKDFFVSSFEDLLKIEIEVHLGYAKNASYRKGTHNRRNGFLQKKVKSSFGPLCIKSPRDRDGTFYPILFDSINKEIAYIEESIFSLYAKGIKEEDLLLLIDKLYSEKVTLDSLNSIKKSLIKRIKSFSSHRLKDTYTALYIDCFYINDDLNLIKDRDEKASKVPLYVFVGLNEDNDAEILGIYKVKSKSKSRWIRIFNKIKTRGVKSFINVYASNLNSIADSVHEAYQDANFITYTH